MLQRWEVVRSREYFRRRVKVIAAMTTVIDAVLGLIRLAAYVRDPF